MTPERQQALLDDLYSGRDVYTTMAQMTDEELIETHRVCFDDFAHTVAFATMNNSDFMPIEDRITIRFMCEEHRRKVEIYWKSTGKLLNEIFRRRILQTHPESMVDIAIRNADRITSASGHKLAAAGLLDR